MSKIKIIVLAGPTASGKTEAAIRLAQGLNGEIVSADSMQIYKYMDIGSAKPTAEERAAAVHHLVDQIDPAQPFSVAAYRRLAGACLQDIAARGKVPIVEGGTGLYVNSIAYDMDFAAPPADPDRRQALRALAEEEGPVALHARLQALDPAAAARIHPHNVTKVIRAIEAAEAGAPIPSFDRAARPSKEYEPLLFCIDRERAQLYDRINRRVDQMLAAGLVEEVESLLARGLTEEDISMKGIGYKEIIACRKGAYDLAAAADAIKKNTRRFAKRQRTWFKRYPDMRWYDVTDGLDAAVEDMLARARQFLED